MSTSKAKEPAGAIVGHVYRQKGSGLGGAKVTCDGMSTTSIFDGSYRFEALGTGTYTVTVELKGFRNQSKTVSIKEDEEVTVDFHLTEATGTAKICGHVYDARTREPIIKGTVILILPVANRYATLDKNGYYEFRDLSADTYDVIASPLDYGDKKATVTVADGETKTQDLYCEPEREEVDWG